MEIEQNNVMNADSDYNSSEYHHNDQNTASQIEVTRQIVQLQNEMNEINTLLTTLTKQVISLL